MDCRAIILGLFCVLLLSCESGATYSGTVFDQEKHPLKGVVIFVQIDGRTQYDYDIETDSSGNFDFLVFEGLLFTLPNCKLIFKKNGFENFELACEWENIHNIEILMQRK